MSSHSTSKGSSSGEGESMTTRISNFFSSGHGPPASARKSASTQEEGMNGSGGEGEGGWKGGSSPTDPPSHSHHFDFHSLGLEELRSAPLVALVDKSTQCFDSEGDLLEGQNLPTCLFLVHQWYVPSVELVRCFTQLYDSSKPRCPRCLALDDEQVPTPSGSVPEPSLARKTINCEINVSTSTLTPPNTVPSSQTTPVLENGRKRMHDQDSTECFSFAYRSRLCFAIRHWIMLFPMHFDENAAVKSGMGELQARMLKDGHSDLAAQLDLSIVPSCAWLRNVSVRNPIMRQFSLSFDQWSPEEIANNLTHIEHRMLRRITFSEYKQYASSCNLQTTPILQRSISSFNSLSSWVQCMVLSKKTPKERAEIMSKFINVGKRLRKLQNFNTLMSVLGGLTHSSLARLAKTNAALPSDIRKDLNEFAELLSQSGNFSAYRKALEQCRGFRIPIIGVHLKDLISLHSALPCYVEEEGGLINMKKLSQLGAIFSHLILDLERNHNLPQANIDLINTLKVSLDIHYKEEEVYELSLKREPRTFLNVYQSLPKSVVFADWAAGVSTAPDPETVNKHVAAMVDAVFKHYDHDRDGYISKAEFDSITGNFPFIDPFTILDVDRDGQISKREMQEYFVKVNQHSTEFRRGFKHNFHETTFLAPTTCSHCSKLLWGLIRQGFKCKDCGLPVHRICKDSVVAECRSDRKSSSSAHPFIQLNRTISLSPDANRHHPKTAPAGGAPTAGTSQIYSSQVSMPANPQNAVHKRRLFLNLRVKPERDRTVSSTVSPSESPTPEPTPPNAEPPSNPSSSSSSLIRILPRIGSRKIRTQSETNDCYRCQSPDLEILPSLASEEVFEEENSNVVQSGKTET